jgi:hypothetical protein
MPYQHGRWKLTAWEPDELFVIFGLQRERVPAFAAPFTVQTQLRFLRNAPLPQLFSFVIRSVSGHFLAFRDNRFLPFVHQILE